MTNDSDYSANLGLFDAAKFITIYVEPIVSVLGIIGNILAAIVFLSRDMRKVSSNIYLTGLSISSVLFLQSLLIVWLEVVGWRLFHQPVWCQCIVFVTYISTFMNIWFVVCITFENYIVMFHIDKATRVCTVVKARIIVGCLTSFAVLVYSFVVWSTHVENLKGVNTCTSSQVHLHVTVAFTYVDVVIALILPMTIIFSLISAIIVKHLSHKWQVTRTNDQTTNHVSIKERRLMKITRVLLAISVSYVLLSSPLYINKIRYLVNASLNISSNQLNEESINKIFHNIFYISFSTNVLFYLLWGNNFKKNLANVLCLEKCQFNLKNRGRKMLRRFTLRNGTLISRLNVPIDDKPSDEKKEPLKSNVNFFQEGNHLLNIPDPKNSDNSVSVLSSMV